MLIPLLSNQISSYWDKLKEPFSKEMGLDDEGMNEVLSSIISGLLTVWISVDDGRVNGFVLTTLGEDNITKRKSLVIYFVTTIGSTNGGNWRNGIESLKKVAKSNNCDRIIATTESQEVVKLCESLGGKLKEYLMEFEIE